MRYGREIHIFINVPHVCPQQIPDVTRRQGYY